MYITFDARHKFPEKASMLCSFGTYIKNNVFFFLLSGVSVMSKQH